MDGGPERLTVLLGRYRLGPEIGRGGMSVVYRADDLDLGRAVAVKLLAPHLSTDPQSRQRLLAEAQAVARLPHPHVVQVFDACTTSDGTVALVMELVDGETLQHRMARGRLTMEEAREIGAQVAEALAAAHRLGIVHRDVKPANILLADQEGTGVHARLADFGIARTSDATGTLTGAGLVMGSAPYIAPELLEGRPAGARGDIYAFGVTLFQMLTGRVPFEAVTTAAALAARLAREAPPLRQLRPDAPAWLERLVAQCLARDPALRLVDAASLAQALRTARSATIATALRVAPAPAVGGNVGVARVIPAGRTGDTAHQTTQVVTVRPRPHAPGHTQAIHSTGAVAPDAAFAQFGSRTPQPPRGGSGDGRSPEAVGRWCGHLAGTLLSRRVPLRLAGAVAVAALLVVGLLATAPRGQGTADEAAAAVPVAEAAAAAAEAPASVAPEATQPPAPPTPTAVIIRLR